MATTDFSESEIPLTSLLSLMYRCAAFEHPKKQYGLTKTQVLLLFALREQDSLNMTQVAEYITASKEQATRSVTPLVEAGYVERFEIPENRTHVYIRMTGLGRELVSTCRSEFYRNFQTRMEKSLSHDDQIRLRESLCAAAEILKKIQ